jgi:hypothetical protein
MLVAIVFAIPLSGETSSGFSNSSTLGTIAIDSVIGACAGIGWGLASTAVVLATTGIEDVASETCGGDITGAEATGATGDAEDDEAAEGL